VIVVKMVHVKDLNEVYQCGICGNVAEIVYAGDGELVCCGVPMDLLTGKTEDEGNEKHKPVVVKQEKGIVVKVGEVPHPMEDKHYIAWIEVVKGDRVVRKQLKPGDAPEMKFCCEGKVGAYCNVHGLWKA
tara:strand:- start:303 stop:692 length:390 start_codon:yes stop_codon:yes gene_type:complete